MTIIAAALPQKCTRAFATMSATAALLFSYSGQVIVVLLDVVVEASMFGTLFCFTKVDALLLGVVWFLWGSAIAADMC